MDWYDTYRKERDSLQLNGTISHNVSMYNINYFIYNCYEDYRYKTGQSNLSPISSGTGMMGDIYFHPKEWVDDFLNELYYHIDCICPSPSFTLKKQTINCRTFRVYSVEEFITALHKHGLDECGFYLFNIVKVKQAHIDKSSYEVRFQLVTDDEHADRKQTIKKRCTGLNDLLN